MTMKIDASGLSFRELNRQIREAVNKKYELIELTNVNGHRYIGDGIALPTNILVYGTAGNDLGAFMNGSSIIVYGNVADAAGNTMNAGKIIIHGRAGDVIGHSMRGGEIFIKESCGYRVGLHMKAYGEKIPNLVIGGFARDFLGEYMAGGRIIVLGLGVEDRNIVGCQIGAGMHGGKIFVRNQIKKEQLGIGTSIQTISEEDLTELKYLLMRYCEFFEAPLDEVIESEFTKIVPVSHRPYGATYALREKSTVTVKTHYV